MKTGSGCRVLQCLLQYLLRVCFNEGWQWTWQEGSHAGVCVRVLKWKRIKISHEMLQWVCCSVCCSAWCVAVCVAMCASVCAVQSKRFSVGFSLGSCFGLKLHTETTVFTQLCYSVCCRVQHPATCCNMLQHTATRVGTPHWNDSFHAALLQCVLQCV
jgi:hypothetical protein